MYSVNIFQNLVYFLFRKIMIERGERIQKFQVIMNLNIVCCYCNINTCLVQPALWPHVSCTSIRSQWCDNMADGRFSDPLGFQCNLKKKRHKRVRLSARGPDSQVTESAGSQRSGLQLHVRSSPLHFPTFLFFAACSERSCFEESAQKRSACDDLPNLSWSLASLRYRLHCLTKNET